MTFRMDQLLRRIYPLFFYADLGSLASKGSEFVLEGLLHGWLLYMVRIYNSFLMQQFTSCRRGYICFLVRKMPRNFGPLTTVKETSSLSILSMWVRPGPVARSYLLSHTEQLPTPDISSVPLL